jgi:hypothetical protein
MCAERTTQAPLSRLPCVHLQVASLIFIAAVVNDVSIFRLLDLIEAATTVAPQTALLCASSRVRSLWLAGLQSVSTLFVCCQHIVCLRVGLSLLREYLSRLLHHW